MEIFLPILFLFLLVLVLWLRSKKMTPEDKLPQCEVILTAPVVAFAPQVWDPNAPWWIETLDFLHENGLR